MFGKGEGMTKLLGFSKLRVKIATLTALGFLAGAAAYGTSNVMFSGPVAGGQTARELPGGV